MTFLFAFVLLPESLQKDALETHHEWISPREVCFFAEQRSNHRLPRFFFVAFFSTFSFAGLETTFPLFIEAGWGVWRARDGMDVHGHGRDCRADTGRIARSIN